MDLRDKPFKVQYLKIKLVFICVLVFGNAFAQRGDNTCPTKANWMQENIDFAQNQIFGILRKETDSTKIPKTTASDGSLLTVDIYDWGSGFFAGSLWHLYELTKKKKWEKEAIKWTTALEPVKTFTGHHDVGFIMYSSYGNAYRMTGNPAYKAILVRTAQSLATRYNSKIGLIKSWNYGKAWDGKTEWFFPVIIDNMMNLELLFFASKATGNPYFKNIAIKHAENTMKNHLRADYSCYHVVDYDSTTGAVKFKGTNQGFTNSSTWARGQAWGIYGFTMVYRETKDKRFLNVAQKMADFFINHKNLPADKIPYWDFNAVDPAYKPEWAYELGRYPVIPRDVSAAAITCSALFELSQYVGKEGSKYRKAAEQILCSLSGLHYRSKLNENNNFLLMHSVGSLPDGLEIDVPLNYADYYYLEALKRYRNLK